MFLRLKVGKSKYYKRISLARSVLKRKKNESCGQSPLIGNAAPMNYIFKYGLHLNSSEFGITLLLLFLVCTIYIL